MYDKNRFRSILVDALNRTALMSMHEMSEIEYEGPYLAIQVRHKFNGTVQVYEFWTDDVWLLNITTSSDLGTSPTTCAEMTRDYSNGYPDALPPHDFEIVPEMIDRAVQESIPHVLNLFNAQS